MTVIEIDRIRPAGPVARLLDWFRRRKERRTQPDITKLLDGLNERLLRDMGYDCEPRRGLRNRHSAMLWMGRTPPEDYWR